MTKSPINKVLTCLLFLFIIINNNATTVLAAPGENSALFQQGQNAFGAGHYKKALQLFRQAEAKGMHKPALYYNIGVCAYSLKEYEQAKTAFKKLIAINKDMAPLAHYNLGLIAMRLDNRQEMKKSFKIAMNTSSDPKIRTLAAAALGDNKRLPTRPVAKPYFAFVEGSIGYDDNIELYSDLLGSNGDGDWFAEMFAAGTKGINGGTLNKGMQLFGSLYYQKFNDFTQYDLGSADIGLQYLYNIKNWQIKPAIDYAYTIQDLKSYDQTPTFSIQANHPFFWQSKIKLEYRLSYIDILDSTYDAVEGTRNKFRSEIIKKWAKTSLSVRYTLELNNRDNINLSPTRHTFSTKLRYRPLDKLSTVAIVDFRKSTYDSTAGIDREEDRWRTTLRAMYYFAPLWTLTAEYAHTNNDANPAYSRYDYTRNVSVLRLERSF